MKIALIQQKFHINKEKTIKKTCQLIQQAVEQGAELICLGELHQSEYFCQSENVDFFDYAKDYEKDVQFWSSVAKKYGVVLLSSLFEKRSAGIYHNTAVVFEKDGLIAGKYRKMHIPDDPCFYEKFYFTPGDLGFEPINTSLGKLGVLICWDQWYPEAARIMALKGAEILIYPTAIGWFDKDEAEEKQRQLNAWLGVQKGHAIANGLHVVAVNRVGFEKDASGVEEGIRFWGNSFVFGPQGEELCLLDSENECVKIVKIDKQRSEKVRQWWPFLRDRRIEYFKDLTKRFID
ncbi:N-carbamoylputrescine amidohydrolase [Campylobacter sp. VicNov18]|uniref:N-carbamoylputrescine amidohydrolase n=1 Tax=Campylobacter bilis TaxID=2691918 RepID=UPI00130EF5CE|nr:N-carbamoylputrescine amidohydrolase [Campylobacter bilis]MPV63876.1 N-carbamoylputrescine amidohydrolase [Campylobacter hepaticus]MBM0637377.1 N-carbamoylputrescine amidohydrolase [Campylobacter bilis]MCC8278098.1 N-carbamoylputrescine amidohydrolase [Campylobacter bilis]MCC8299602.1 N-carbamoylputrescine amidohydrolase [Campylobacter bilis]MCC8301007.1 N-carbamoylputrescine amidohydrolase [Campylobacter bilis]